MTKENVKKLEKKMRTIGLVIGLVIGTLVSCVKTTHRSVITKCEVTTYEDGKAITEDKLTGKITVREIMK